MSTKSNKKIITEPEDTAEPEKKVKKTKPSKVITISEEVQVRDYPDKSSGCSVVLNKNHILEVISTKEEFTEVKLNNLITGFVKNSDVKEVK